MKNTFFRDDEMSLEVKGNIAGMADARIEYYFGNNDDLHEACYYLYYGEDPSVYNQYLDVLVSKYGEPNANDAWKEALKTIVWTGSLQSITINSMLGSKVNNYNSSVWLIEEDNGDYVSIELLDVNRTTSENITGEVVTITYAKFSEEEVINYTSAANDNAEQYQSQLYDDL